MEEMILYPLIGGVLIGLAVTMMLLFNGRVTGISGIISSSFSAPKDGPWRYTFVIGMVAGGFILNLLNPEMFENTTNRGLGSMVLAGLLVGFGTVMGSGCTSGHGVCGISRFSIRSLLATIVFMTLGILAVASYNALFGGVL